MDTKGDCRVSRFTCRYIYSYSLFLLMGLCWDKLRSTNPSLGVKVMASGPSHHMRKSRVSLCHLWGCRRRTRPSSRAQSGGMSKPLRSIDLCGEITSRKQGVRKKSRLSFGDEEITCRRQTRDGNISNFVHTLHVHHTSAMHSTLDNIYLEHQVISDLVQLYDKASLVIAIQGDEMFVTRGRVESLDSHRRL